MVGITPKPPVPGWPEYVADLKARGIWEKKELREAAAAKWDILMRQQQLEDEAPIVADLRASGVEVESPWEIVNRKVSFPAAMPVLFKHLKLPYPAKVREGIARAMSDKAAGPYWLELADLFKEEPDGPIRDAIAVALCGAVNPDRFDDLISLVMDPAYGSGRVGLIWALEHAMPAELALPVLVELTKDRVTKLQAEISLKKVRRKRAREVK